jgi:hypothetical protein
MIANGSMDCDYHVVVTITNDAALAFHGQSATADSWIVGLDLGPGESKAITAQLRNTLSESGRVAGTLSDGTKVFTPWTASRDVACGAPTTTTTAPVDTTPHQTVIGGVPVCIVPGSPTQEPVSCDSPRATTPDPTTTTAVVAQEPSTALAGSPVATDTDKTASEVRTGPPKSHHVATTAPAASLPVTGSPSVPLGSVGVMSVLVGVVLVCLTHRRACKQ